MAFENCSEPLMCRTTTEMVGYLIIMPLVTVFGVVFNIMNLVVMHTPEFKLPTAMKYYLAAMAIADLMASFFAFFLGFARCLPILIPGIDAIRFVDWYLVVPIGNIFGTLSSWTNVAVAFQRYRVLRHHEHFAQCGGSCNPKVSKLVIGIISCAAVLLNSVLFMPRFYVAGNGCVERSSLYKGNFYTVWSWIRLFLTKIFPILSVIFLNALLVHFVWKNFRDSHTKVMALGTVRKGDAWRRKHGRLTVMLIGISAVYLLCNIPEPFSHYAIFAALFGEENRLTAGHFIFRVIINILEATWFAINFLFYFGFNRNFRISVSKICRRKIFETRDGLQETAAPSFISRSATIRIVRPLNTT